MLAIEEQVPDLVKQKVKLKFFGRIDDFGSKIINKINDAEKATDINKPSLLFKNNFKFKCFFYRIQKLLNTKILVY